MARPTKETGNPVPGFDPDFRDRLQSLISEFVDQDEAAAAAGATTRRLISWKNGRSRPDFFALKQLCDQRGANVHWLATGEGPRDISHVGALLPVGVQRNRMDGQSMQIGEVMMPGKDVVMLPRLAVEASAGRGVVSNSEEVAGLVGLSAAYLRQIGVDPQHAHMLQVSGRSMIPTISDRDVVVVDTSKTTIVNEGIYTLVYGDAVLVKRIRMLRDGSINIVSDNKSEGYGDEIVSRAEMNTLRIVGQVKGQVRPL